MATGGMTHRCLAMRRQSMFDETASSDLVIQCLVDRRDELKTGLATISEKLHGYVRQLTVVVARPAISPQEHYNMLDEGICGCGVCVDWDMRREEFTRAIKLIPKGHKWTVCACDLCRFVGRFQLNLLAAANRRELLIEMSFHARYHSYHGGLVMNWLEVELRNPSYTPNWCAQEMSRYPMERWLQRCEMAVSGVVGGPVFVTSARMTDAVANVGSSLSAEVGEYRTYSAHLGAGGWIGA